MREMRVALSIEPAFRGFWRSSVRFLWLAPKRRAPTDGRVYFILINGLMVPRGGIEPPTLRFSVAFSVVSTIIIRFH